LFPRLYGGALLIGLLTAYAVGGALLGAATGHPGRAPAAALGHARPRPAPPAGTSGIAIVAAILGILGLVLGTAFPLRFRVPEGFVFFLIVVSMLGLDSAAPRAAFLLAVVGLPALVAAVVALGAIRRGLFLQEAFTAWRDDPLPPPTVSPWSYGYERG